MTRPNDSESDAERDSEDAATTQERLASVPLCGSFASVAPLLAGRRVCDLGCNDGHYLQFAGPGSLGLDVNDASLSACRQKGLKVQPHDLNALPLPIADAAFEVVLLSHVLEHVTMPLHMLRECNRILPMGGLLIVGLPIEDGLYSRLRMDYFGGREGHLYSFSLANLRKLLALCGFAKERVICHLPRLGNRLSAWNDRLQQLFGEHLYTLSAAYWFLARKIDLPVADDRLSDYFSR